jgi:hypothetical protein
MNGDLDPSAPLARSFPMRRHLPLVSDDSFLDSLGVAAPCDAEWSAMRGDDRVRHCGQCRQNVYNLSAMTRAEAATLIRAREGRLCVRMLQRSDGTLVARDCRERLREARRRGYRAFLATLVLVLVAHLAVRVAVVRGLWVTLFSGQPAPVIELPLPNRVVMGEMSAPPVPTPPVRMGHIMGKVARPLPSKKHKCDPNDPLCDTLGDIE